MGCPYCNYVPGKVYSVGGSTCTSCWVRGEASHKEGVYVGIMNNSPIGRAHKFKLLHPIRCSNCGTLIGYWLLKCRPGEVQQKVRRNKHNDELVKELFGEKVRVR